MAVTFPNSPTLNEEYTAENGLLYVWDGEKWKTFGSYAADAGEVVLTSPNGSRFRLEVSNSGTLSTTLIP